jgi:hypothetical protein
MKNARLDGKSELITEIDSSIFNFFNLSYLMLFVKSKILLQN